jgi:hypothetical protein
MRDPMHQIDLGVIHHHIKAVLLKYKEFVEDVLGINGKAAEKLGLSEICSKGKMV